eukprot:TRINITY_DN23057_c0_g1_i1.p1 TRINITY_DN23057_c0_g1~~TRINITY_DN23057_c0_g1_i1.p1  ORF type:complete len:364 (+),score=66.43 TRINITY_DN23057_c0_g1_i1:92-1183(+)
MSRGIHFISNNIPGYGPSEGKCLPCSGISGRASLSSHSCRSICKPFPHVKILLKSSTVYNSKRTSFACTASSSNHRRNPDFSRQNKQGHGYSRSRNRQNQERENPEILEETELLSSKNGPLLSLSGSPRFQATSTPGPREKEIVELFRKVQAQLRERAAIKEEKKIEAASHGQGERGTVDSLLKLLRKHSVEQGKRKSGAEDFNLDSTERNSAFDDEQNSNFFDSNTVVTEEAPEEGPAPFMRPASNFRRKSPVPRVKYQPVYTTNEVTTSNSSPKLQGKKKKNVIHSDPDPVSSDARDESFNELSESSDVDESYDEISEPVPAEHVDLSTLKLSDLRTLAKSRGVKGYSKLKKAELVELLSE